MGHRRTEIAKELEVHKSTIGRELHRNTGERGYRPKQANEKACERRLNAAHKERISAETWEVVEEELRQDWSPEQVSGYIPFRFSWVHLLQSHSNDTIDTTIVTHGLTPVLPWPEKHSVPSLAIVIC